MYNRATIHNTQFSIYIQIVYLIIQHVSSSRQFWFAPHNQIVYWAGDWSHSLSQDRIIRFFENPNFISVLEVFHFLICIWITQRTNSFFYSFLKLLEIPWDLTFIYSQLSWFFRKSEFKISMLYNYSLFIHWRIPNFHMVGKVPHSTNTDGSNLEKESKLYRYWLEDRVENDIKSFRHIEICVEWYIRENKQLPY